MNETVVTLLVVALAASLYWPCAMRKKGGCKLENLVVLLFNAVGIVTGIYIFVGALKVQVQSSQDAIWGGITGVCMTLYMLERAWLAFRELFLPEVQPSKADSSNLK